MKLHMASHDSCKCPMQVALLTVDTIYLYQTSVRLMRGKKSYRLILKTAVAAVKHSPCFDKLSTNDF